MHFVVYVEMRLLLLILFTLLATSAAAQDSCDTLNYYKRDLIQFREIQCDGSPWTTFEEFNKKGQLICRYFELEKIKRSTSKKIVWHSTIDSVYTEYNQNHPTLQIEMKNGNFHGRYIHFHPMSNDTHLIYLYENDKFIGLEKEFFKNKRVKQEYTYRNDSIVSVKTYDTSGNLLGGTVLENGNGYVTFCNDNGTLCCRCDIVNNKVKNCSPIATWEKKQKKKKSKKP